MVLKPVKQLDQVVSLTDVQNVTILGLDQGGVLLFAATSTCLFRNSNTRRTVIGGVQLNDGEQQVFYRHGTCVKVTHASVNAARSLCCFVTRTESSRFDVFVAEIGLPGQGRLFSLDFARSSSIRAYMTRDDAILLLYKDSASVFRLPNSENNRSGQQDESATIQANTRLNKCLYYQWDAVLQRLHVIQRRSPTTLSSMPVNGHEALIYTAYVLNAKGHFDSIMTITFALPLPSSSSSQSNFEILSNDTSLFLCWQSTMQDTNDKMEYAVVSLGHGRSVYVSQMLITSNLAVFSSRKIHFGLVDGDYVFVYLRGEFVHLLNFNVASNFVNHLFLSDETILLPYDVKYTTQRGHAYENRTLLYGKLHLLTYTIEIDRQALVCAATSSTMVPIITYALVALKDAQLLSLLLARLLHLMYDDLDAKTYLKEILTALIFYRLSKKLQHHKYVLVFPSTTVNHSTINVTQAIIRSAMHHRFDAPEQSRTTNVDKNYVDKLKSSFDLSRKYRHKVSYNHPIMSMMDDNETSSTENMDISGSRNRRLNSTGTSSAPLSPIGSIERRPTLARLFDSSTRKKSFSMQSSPSPIAVNKMPLIYDPKHQHLFASVSGELERLHPSWEKRRIHELSWEYIQTTQIQCDVVVKLLSRLLRFDRQQQPLLRDESSTERFKALLALMEKLYLAMIELGFSPTDELQQSLLDVSFRVMPFDRFIDAIDQRILILTEEFVTRVVMELNNDPTSSLIKEQLILMLPSTNSDVHSRLFSLMNNGRGHRMAAQFLVARRFLSENKRGNNLPSTRTNTLSITHSHEEVQDDEMMNVNPSMQSSSNHHGLVGQAAVTFLRDYRRRGITDEDEIGQVKTGLVFLASSAP